MKTPKSNHTSAKIVRNLPLWLTLLLATLAPRWAQANLTGPYTADANTTVLLHIDSAAGTSSVTNLGTLGGTFYSVTGSGNPSSATKITTVLGAQGYSVTLPTPVSFNLCQTNPTSQTATCELAYDYNRDGIVNLGGAVTDPDFFPMSALNMGNGGQTPWTVECLVKPSTTNFGTRQYVVGTDTAAGGGNSYRGFWLSLATASGQSSLTFEALNINPANNSVSFTANIPMTGNDAVVPGNWYHAAATYDGTNVYLYWTLLNPTNGACHLLPGGQIPGNLTNTWGNNKGILTIGNTGRSPTANGSFTNGCIDEVRIYSACLAPNQMQFFSPAVSITSQPYALQNVDYNGTAVFSVGATTTGSTLGYQWRFNSNSIAGATNTSYTIPNVASFNAGYYDCLVTNTLGYSNITTEASLVVGAANFLSHRYSFNTNYIDPTSGLTATPDSVGGANGTNFGDAYISGGQLVLDGTSGTYMQLPPFLFSTATATALTVEFWATFGNNSDNAVVYEFGSQAVFGSGVVFGDPFLSFVPDNLAGLPVSRMSSSDLPTAEYVTNAIPFDGQAVHVACTYDPPNKTIAIYTNGLLAASNTLSYALSTVNDTLSYVGKSLFQVDNESGGATTPYFNGSIDEFRIYNGALNTLSLQQSDNLGPNQVLADGPVTFTTQPASTDVAIGNTAAFTATAVGYLPIYYQWFTNGVPVPGATNSSFSFVPTLGDNNDQVVCYATNTIGATTYSTNTVTATLLVVNPATVIWTANSSDVWDSSTLNWTNSDGTAGFVAYGPLDLVTFDDEFNAAGTVDLAQAVNPQSITLNSTNTYKFISSNHQGSLTGPGLLALNNSGTLILDVTNNLTSGVTIASGTLQIGNGDTLGSLGNNLPVTDNGMLTFDRTDTIVVGNVISGSGGVNYNGPGTVMVLGLNTYSGGTFLTNGTVHLGAPQSGTTAGPLGAGGSISFNGGWLQYSGINQYDYSGNFSSADGQAFNVDTAGQNVTWATGLNGLGSTLTKVGLGALTLSGGNTYTGNTVISNGTLQVVSLTGNLTMASGTTLVVGGSNTVATLSLGGNLTLNANTLVLDITNLATASTINVAGNFTPSGVTTIVLSNTNPLPNGSYPLLTVTGTLGGTAANFSVASQSPKTYAVAYVGNQVVLQVSGSVSAFTWIGNGGYPPGGGNNYWDINTSTNWGELGGAATPIYVVTNGYPVIFDDTAAIYTVNIPAAVAPSSVVVNAANGYTFSGAGGISGATALTKTNTGTLTISTVNSYTGPTTVNGGTLAVSADNNLGAAPGAATPGNVVLNGGTLQASTGFTLNANRGLALGPTNGSGIGTIAVPIGQTLTYGGVVANNGSGTGGLTLTDAGTLSLSGTNTYTGATTVSSGELDVSNWGTNILGTTTVGNTAGVTGTLGITGGTLNFGANNVYVSNGGGTGIVNQPGGKVAFTGGSAVLVGNGVGDGSTGTYNLSGGTLFVNFASTTRGVMLGVNTGCMANFNLSGSGILNMPAAELAVGRNDSAVTGCTVAFNQTGGAATVGYLSIGGQAGATGTTATFNLTNGTFVATNFQNLVAAASSSASIYLGGGAQVTLPAFPTNGGPVNLTFDFTNGYLAPLASSTNYLSGLTNAYLTTNGANFNVRSGVAITVAQELQDQTAGGTLTKSGAGTLTLTGTNTYTGATTVSSGTLMVNNPTGSGTGTGAVTVNSGGTLGGTGTISGIVTNQAGGTLLPGSGGVGTLTISGNLTLNAGSTNTFAVNGSTLANTSVALGGAVSYGGVLNIVTNGTFVSGQTFTLFSGAGAASAGNFASLTGSPGAGLAFSFTNGVLSVVSAGPTLTSVTPSSVAGSSYPVTLGLTGSGFTGATAVWLTNVTAAAGASYPFTFNSDTSISVSFVPGTPTTTAAWNATVLNGTPSASVGFTVTAPTPVSINAANLNSAGAGKLVLSGTGGTPGYSYVVAGATNLTPPVVWVPVVTNVFGTGGSFSYTNTVNLNMLDLFLHIQQ